MESITFSADPESFGKIKIRTEGRRMKLYINLNKEETDGWNNIKTAFTDGSMSDDQLARVFLFRGIQGMNDDLNARINSMTDEEREAALAEFNEETATEETATEETATEETATEETATEELVTDGTSK
jgi:hypothetical protein